MRPQPPAVPLARLLAPRPPAPLWHMAAERYARLHAKVGYIPYFVLLLMALIFARVFVVAVLYLFTIVLTVIFFSAAVGLPILMVFGNTMESSRFSMKMARALSALHERRVWDVLCTTPEGVTGVIWAAWDYAIGRYTAFHDRYAVWRISALPVIALSIIVSVLVTVFSGNLRVLHLFALANGLFLVILLDHGFSPLVGFLVGALAGLSTTNRADAAVRALGGYLFLKMLVYAGTMLVSFTLLPRLAGLDALWLALAQPLLILAAFAALHKIAIALLWRALAVELGLSLNEFTAYPFGQEKAV
jgi:hypothetical protein